MANEITIRAGMSVRGGNVSYPFSASYRADMTGRKAPSPGGFDASPSGTDVVLTELTQPHWAWIENVEPAGGSRTEWGIWDPETSRFYPVWELEPGEKFLIPFARALQWEYGTGTGTTSTSPTNTLRVYSKGAAAANVAVYAFER